MPLFFRREELPSRRSATRLSILLERRCKLDRILRDLLQVHLVVFNGSVGGKLRLTDLEALEDEGLHSVALLVEHEAVEHTMITCVCLGVFGQDLDFIARSLQPRGHGLKQLRGRRARNYAELVVCGRGSLLGLGAKTAAPLSTWIQPLWGTTAVS